MTMIMIKMAKMMTMRGVSLTPKLRLPSVSLEINQSSRAAICLNPQYVIVIVIVMILIISMIIDLFHEMFEEKQPRHQRSYHLSTTSCYRVLSNHVNLIKYHQLMTIEV